MVLRIAAQQTWPSFVLVAGLLLVGRVDHAEGLFERAASSLDRLAGGTRVLFVASCGAVVVVTAVLNLDTAVVFLTPVLVLAARRRGADERPFLFAAVFMANASSLFLPGSNLTNLLVLAEHPVSGATFASRMLPAASAAVIATTAGLLVLYRVPLGRRSAPTVGDAPRPASRVSRFALAVTAAAAALTVVLARPALAVLALGVVAGATEVARGRLSVRAMLNALGAPVLAALFCLSVALGVLTREWAAPAHLLAHAGRWGTAAIGAGAAVLVNNLPAAALRAPCRAPAGVARRTQPRTQSRVTGSLSAYLWYRTARQHAIRPSLREFSRCGVLLAPAAVVAALLFAGLISSF